MRLVVGLLLVGAAASQEHLRSVRLQADLNPAEAGHYEDTQRLLYVALPQSDEQDPDRSLRILVFDIARGHRLVKRIPLGRNDDGETVRGTAADAGAGRFYVSTTQRLAALDLRTDRVVWQERYADRCCDRLAVSPDGKTIYAPAFGRANWYVIDAATGNLRSTLAVTGWPRQTIYSRDGRHAYLGAWDSNILSVADTTKHSIVGTVGPFSASLCPFTINAAGTLAFANVNGLVGFEVGDLQTGLILDSVAAEGYDKDEAAAYECPSHGIAFAPDGRELWVADGVRNRLLVFDASVYPPKELSAIQLQTQPRWIAFSSDGAFAYSSTGDVIAATDKKIAGSLEERAGVKVTSENFLEITVNRP